MSAALTGWLWAKSAKYNMSYTSKESVFDVETWFEDADQSIALVVLKGAGKHVINHGCSTTYEVISGSGRFLLDKKDYPQHMQAGSRIDVEQGQGYQDFGDMVMLATSTPAFEEMMVEELH